MDQMRYAITVAAPRAKVWDTMLQDATYRERTSVFNKGGSRTAWSTRQKWAPAFENYAFSEKDGGTEPVASGRSLAPPRARPHDGQRKEGACDERT